MTRENLVSDLYVTSPCKRSHRDLLVTTVQNYHTASPQFIVRGQRERFDWHAYPTLAAPYATQKTKRCSHHLNSQLNDETSPLLYSPLAPDPHLLVAP